MIFLSLQRKIKSWIMVNIEPGEVEVQPSDSVNLGSRRSQRTAGTVSCSQSSTSETRVKLSVKRASLEVDAAAPSEQLLLAQTKLELEQQELKLKLHTDLTKLHAQERIYEELGSKEQKKERKVVSEAHVEVAREQQVAVESAERCSEQGYPLAS